jgi:ribosomal 30S subunit maturation factor RimM
VNERRDDTTKPETESPRARRPGSYYYDDATGYEIYKPEEEDEGGGKVTGDAETDDESARA